MTFHLRVLNNLKVKEECHLFPFSLVGMPTSGNDFESPYVVLVYDASGGVSFTTTSLCCGNFSSSSVRPNFERLICKEKRRGG